MLIKQKTVEKTDVKHSVRSYRSSKTDDDFFKNKFFSSESEMFQKLPDIQSGVYESMRTNDALRHIARCASNERTNRHNNLHEHEEEEKMSGGNQGNEYSLMNGSPTGSCYEKSNIDWTKDLLSHVRPLLPPYLKINSNNESHNDFPPITNIRTLAAIKAQFIRELLDRQNHSIHANLSLLQSMSNLTSTIIKV